MTTSTTAAATRQKRVAKHKKFARELLQEAEEKFAKGDMVRASEDGWEAGAHAIIAAGIPRGIECQDYREMQFTAYDLIEETGDMGLYKLFLSVEALWANTREDWLPPKEVRFWLDRARKYVETLESIPAPEGEPPVRPSRSALFIRDAKDWDEWKEANWT